MRITNDIDLTNVELGRYVLDLCKEEKNMKGTIRPTSREAKCPKCNENFLHISKLGYGCPKCKTFPKRFYIDIHYRNKRYTICSDKSGQVLDTYQRAMNIQARIQYELENDIFTPSKYVAVELKRFRIDLLLDEFLLAKQKSIAPSNTGYKKYIERAKEFFVNQAGISDVRDIRKKDLIDYLEWLKEQRKTSGENLKSKSIVNIFNNFKTFMKWLKNRKEIIETEPNFPTYEEIDEILSEILVNEKPFQYTWFSAENQREMLTAIDNPDDKEFVRFLFLHPCRPGEARALKLKQIDLQLGKIDINSTFSNRVLRQRRKGKKSKPYSLPIHPEMVDFVKEKVRNNPFDKEAFLFVNPRSGDNYSQVSIDRLFQKIRKKLNIPKTVRFYDATRHSGISQLLNAGTPIYFVSKLAGHSSIKMTEQVYGHESIETLRNEISKLSLKEKGEVVSIDSIKKINNSNI